MEKPVDVTQALKELGISLEDYLSLTGELKKHLEQVMPELETACNKSDFAAIKHLSHSLKGGLLNLRFFAAAAIALQLEKAVESREAARLPELFNALQRALRAGLKHIEIFY